MTTCSIRSWRMEWCRYESVRNCPTFTCGLRVQSRASHLPPCLRSPPATPASQINATHSNLKQYVQELRLDLHTPIRDVKRKLYTHNGSSIEHMELHLKDGERTVCKMLDDARPLGFYGVTNGMEIHVVDTDPFSLSRNGGLDDVSQIEKYRMSDVTYDKLDNSLRAYKRKMQAADPTFKLVPSNRARPSDAPLLTPEEYAMPECVAGLAVGQRVEVAPGARRGTIKHVGEVAGLAPGFWVGVALDEPVGKGTGERGGVVYFECGDRYGSFVRPNFVVSGDFPPEDDFGCGEGEEEAEGACCGGAHHSHPDSATTVSKEEGAAAEGAAAAVVAVAPAVVMTGKIVGSKAPRQRRRGAGDDDEDDDDEEL